MVYISESYNTDAKDRLTAVLEDETVRFILWSDEQRLLKYESLGLGAFLDFLGNDIDCRSAQLYFAERDFHLLPRNLYEQDKDSIYLQQITDEPGDRVAHSISVDFLDVAGSYYVDFETVANIKSRVSEVSYSHFLEIYLSLIRPQLFDMKFKGVMMHVFTKSVMIAYVQGGQLKFLNHFDYKTRDDVLYYILAIYERFGQDPHVVPLILSGDIDIDGKIFKRIWEYVKYVDFLKTNNDYHFDNIEFPLKPHQVIALL